MKTVVSFLMMVPFFIFLWLTIFFDTLWILDSLQVATYTFLEELTGEKAASEKEKALACQVGASFS